MKRKKKDFNTNTNHSKFTQSTTSLQILTCVTLRTCRMHAARLIKQCNDSKMSFKAQFADGKAYYMKSNEGY